MKKLILNLLFFFSFANSYAFSIGDSLFISLRSDKVNLRGGPGNEYSIKYVYEARYLPLKVLGEYENWYKVEDKDNEEGWLNKNLTSKKRYLIVTNGTQIMYEDDDLKSNPIFRLEENVIVKYKKCNSDWCKVEVNDRNGWIQAQNVWGY